MDQEETGEVWGFSRHLFNTQTQFISQRQNFAFFSARIWRQKLNKNPILKINNQQGNNACLWLADWLTERCRKVWKESHLENSAASSSQSPPVKSGEWWKIKLLMLFVIKYYQHGTGQASISSVSFKKKMHLHDIIPLLIRSSALFACICSKYVS